MTLEQEAEVQQRLNDAANGYCSPDNAVYVRHVGWLLKERRRLQAFKDWVHTYLDGKEVPHHPPGDHGAAGCRIGDRMDWVFAQQQAVLDGIGGMKDGAVIRIQDLEARIKELEADVLTTKLVNERLQVVEQAAKKEIRRLEELTVQQAYDQAGPEA